MKNKQYCVLEHPFLYVVFEHSFGTVDAKLHALCTTKEVALGKIAKLKTKGRDGYMTALKKPIEGPTPRTCQYNKSTFTSIVVLE